MLVLDNFPWSVSFRFTHNPCNYCFSSGYELWLLSHMTETTIWSELLHSNILHIILCPHSGSCDGYTNVTEPWRNRAFVTSFFPKDDGNLLNSWWRFTGIGGDRVITDCLSPYFGGTWHTIYIPFMYPTNDSVTPTKGTAYAYYYFCDTLSFQVSVTLCPGGFYIYQPLSQPYVLSGYVTCEYMLIADTLS